MGAPTSCPNCGVELRGAARFCDACGAALAAASQRAEYKQVTVLFADVVRSMDLAAAVGAERLREIMADLVGRSTTVVRRYGGMVDKFTGDGIMALFGAPVALEDHALRACRAAEDLLKQADALSTELADRDGVTLLLRIGLNSGQVVAGEIGSGAIGYTAIGEHVGMAQRMESAAPPGGVMLGESTARLVDAAASLGPPESLLVKGFSQPVAARRLITTLGEPADRRRHESPLVGRANELGLLAEALESAAGGAGHVVTLVGPAGMGKSRLVNEVVALADRRGVDVYSVYCESHAADIPFHAAARLMRSVFGVDSADSSAVRAKLETLAADSTDLALLEELIGVRDPAAESPNVAADARGRRIDRLVAGAARAFPGVYVLEDVHWIDGVSEAMLAGLVAEIAQTSSMAIITYRPEYRGGLTRIANARNIALTPLGDSLTSELVTGLLGRHPSLTQLSTQIADRAAGNPFFAEELIRDLAERRMLSGCRGAYVHQDRSAGLRVPASLHAAIASRIDRLDARAKLALGAAAVIGNRFDADLLSTAIDGPPRGVIDELVNADLVEHVSAATGTEYAFAHPLFRTVAYESQLRSRRAELHRCVGTAIERRDPLAADQNAAAIADHLESAEDWAAAFGWHMRAGAWATTRDVRAARVSWRRARDAADRLPAATPGLTAMRTGPRILLSATAWREGIPISDAGFEELRELGAGDELTQAVCTVIAAAERYRERDYRESSRLTTEVVAMAEHIGDPDVTIRLVGSVIVFKVQTGEVSELLRLAQMIIDLAEGDPARGYVPRASVGSPLAVALTIRGIARCCLGLPGWAEDFDEAITLARRFDLTTRAMVTSFTRGAAVSQGWLLADPADLDDSAEILALAEQSGDDVTLATARIARGVALIYGPEPDPSGYRLLAETRDLAARCGLSSWLGFLEIHAANAKAHAGDADGAIVGLRASIDTLLELGDLAWVGSATATLVEFLLARGDAGDLEEAQAVVRKAAQMPTEEGEVSHAIVLVRMRAALAGALGDRAEYIRLTQDYRAKARELGFVGHMALADAMGDR